MFGLRNKPEIANEETEKGGALERIRASKIRRCISGIAAAAALAIAPTAKAESPNLEIESVGSLSFCPTGYLSEGDHKHEEHEHEEHEHGELRCKKGNPLKLTVSYTNATIDLSLDKAEDGHSEDKDHLEEPEDDHSMGHPSHRVRLQIGTLLGDFEIALKTELALPLEGEEIQFGFGGSLGAHFGDHELSISGLGRFAHADTSAEGLISYTWYINNYLALGAGCMVESHSGEEGTEVHWGCGPNIQASFGPIFVAFDGAWGPEDWAHYHIQIGIGFAIGRDGLEVTRSTHSH